jgi:8-oxo-dGTP pyrophosphatase MutT (NUDIX family)
VAVWHEGRVLAVRQTYRRGLTFPGGGLCRGETPADAARRELAEETGLTVPPAALRPAWYQVAEWDFRRDHVHIFELILPEAPLLHPDRREIAEALFLDPSALLASPLPVFVRDYLLSACRG